MGGWCKTELYGARRPVDREIVLERRAEFRLRSRERRNCAPFPLPLFTSLLDEQARKKESRDGDKKETREERSYMGYRYGVANARDEDKEKWRGVNGRDEEMDREEERDRRAYGRNSV